MKKIVSFLFTLCLSVPMFGQTAIKVMSYNDRLSMADDGMNSWRFRKSATARMLQLERPAVLGMQEACPDQVAYIDSVMPQYHHVGVGREDGKLEGEMMAVFYDTTLLDLQQWGNFWLSETPNEVSKGWDAACKRTCTWTLMRYKNTGQRFLFLNTHLDHMGPVARREEVRMIADSIRSLAHRFDLGERPIVFLTADFNTGSENPIFQPLKTILHEARSTCPVTDNEYTFNGFGKVDPKAANMLDIDGNSDDEIVIDHIFYQGSKPLAFRVLRNDFGAPFISDHFPIVMEAELPAPRPAVRILAIGNSFSVDAVNQYFYEIAKDRGINVVVGNLYHGGCSLERHAKNVRDNISDYDYYKIKDGLRWNHPSTISEAMADEPWDIITMQQASHFSGQVGTYDPYLTELIDSVHSLRHALDLEPLGAETNPLLAWHMTWAYSKNAKHDAFVNYGRSQKKMYAAIVNALDNAVLPHHFDKVIPCGTAIQNARATRLGDTLNRDGYHLELNYGRYCAALTWAETLLGIDAREVTWKPEKVTAEQAALVREAAHKAVSERK